MVEKIREKVIEVNEVRGRIYYTYVMCCLSIHEAWQEESFLHPPLLSSTAHWCTATGSSTRRGVQHRRCRHQPRAAPFCTTFKRNAKVRWRMDRVGSYLSNGAGISFSWIPRVCEGRGRQTPSERFRTRSRHSRRRRRLLILFFKFFCPLPSSCSIFELKNKRHASGGRKTSAGLACCCIYFPSFLCGTVTRLHNDFVIA